MLDASESSDAALGVRFAQSVLVDHVGMWVLRMDPRPTYSVAFPILPFALATSKRKLQSLPAGEFLVHPFAARSRPNIWDLGADCLEARNTPFGLNFRERRPL